MSTYYETKIENFKLRKAEEKDAGLILEFIKKIATYEKMLDAVVATEEDIFDSVFVKHYCECLIGELDGKPVGFALYYYSFSTFLGKSNLYVEDVFYDPEVRGKGLGKATFACLAKIANEHDCGRMEWFCLDWNEPSIIFYKGLGAIPMSDWTIYRLPKPEVKKLEDSL